MIFKRLFGHILLAWCFVLFLAACEPGTNEYATYFPLVVPESDMVTSIENIISQPITQTTIDQINGYRVTYTSLLTNTKSDHSGFSVNEYAWQKADNTYGFNSLNMLKFVTDESADYVMEEEYLIDDKIYIGVMERVGEGDRAEVAARSIVRPILTLETGNKSLGGIDYFPMPIPEIIYHFPMTIGEIISHSEVIEDEVVSGLLTTHYRTTDSEVIVNTSFFYSPESLISSSAQADFWVTADRQYVIRFAVVIEEMEGSIQAYRYEYLASDINQEFDITLRPGAQAQIDAVREALAAGQGAHVTCDECIFPVLPESRIALHPMSDDIVVLSFPGNGRTLDEITTLYEQRLLELGWTVTNQDGWHVTDGTHDFTLHFNHMLDDENDWFEINIAPDPL